MEKTNTQNEKDRRIKNPPFIKPKNKNGGVQFSPRYWAYTIAKRHLGEESKSKVFPIGQDGQLSNRSDKTAKTQTTPSLKATGQYMKSDDQFIKETQKLSDAMRVRSVDGVSSTLKGLGGGMGAKTGLYDVSKIIQKSPDWREDRTLREFTEYSPTIRAEMGDNMPMVSHVSDTLTAIGQPPFPNGKKLSDIRMGNYSHSWDFPEEFGVVTDEEKAFLMQLLSVRRKKGYGSVPDRDGSPVWINKLENVHLIDSLVSKGYLVRTDDTVEFKRSRNSIDDLRHTRIRRLTPVECERLQGFTDGWSEFGIVDGKEVVISDTQRYKCLGNAVSTPVITDIAKRL